MCRRVGGKGVAHSKYMVAEMMKGVGITPLLLCLLGNSLLLLNMIYTSVCSPPVVSVM